MTRDSEVYFTEGIQFEYLEVLKVDVSEQLNILATRGVNFVSVLEYGTVGFSSKEDIC